MNKNNRNNEQIYGRNDMIMLDQNNKIYGSIGLADNYVMKTEEGTRLMLSNPKLGKFGDVLTEFNIYGWSKQERTTGAQLLDIKNIGGSAGEIASTQHDGYVITAQGVYAEGDNSAYRNVSIELDTAKVAGKIITASVESAENDAGEALRLICDINYKKPDGTTSLNLFGMNKPITVSIPADAKLVKCRIHIIEENEKTIGYGTYTTTIKGLMVSIGDIVIPWEPYTGGQPSPSPDYPQEIKSVVNPIVKVTNEDETESQTVTLPYTLNAIPVSSGGNVTIGEQQYISDYLDIEKGKLYRKVTRLNLKDVDAISIAHGFHSNGNGYLSFSVKNVSKEHWLISNRYKGSMYTQESGYTYIPNSNTIVFVDDRFTDKQTAIKLVQDTYVIYALSTPTEEDLSLEQIKSIKSLSTYYPVTIVENNYNTWMKATYKSTESV